ncbi:MAG: hypothetical protein V4640_12080 [Verrucomicrobiota bacterium]
MKTPCCWLSAALLSLPCGAAQIADESFDYAADSSLTIQGGGSGWLGAWFQDGESAVTGAAGLGFTDSRGNVLNTSGLSADTSGSATTRSLRDFGSGLLNNVWISFLYRLPAVNSKFEGVSFYRGTVPTFSINNPGYATTAAIYLSNNLIADAGLNTGRGTISQTHLIVLKLTKGGGTAGMDRIEAFIDPVLADDPSSPLAAINGANFDFDRVRIAGQDGSRLLVDELRVGDSFADVTPHSSVVDIDGDKDGLTDSQEAILGLDPEMSDAVLIAGIREHPDWFDLYTTPGILGLGKGGVVLPGNSNEPVNLIFEVQHSENLTQWGILETIKWPITLPAEKNFLRVTIQ